MEVETISERTRHEGVVSLRIAFDRDCLDMRETPFGLAFEFEGLTTFGLPGEPALPRTSIHIAIPEGGWPTGVEVAHEKVVPLTDEPVLVMPVQPLRPGVTRQRKPPDERSPPRDYSPECDKQPGRLESEPPREQEDEFVVVPFPEPAPVPPDPALYERAARDRRVARPTALEQIGRTPVMRVELRPVRLKADGLLEFTTEIELRVAYAPRPKERVPAEELRRLLEKEGVKGIDFDHLVPLPEPKVTSRGQARRDAELVRALVVNPATIRDWWDVLPYLELPAEYLIITDNQTWNSDTIAPAGAVTGDMVAEFSRLAAWKRSRGMTAKVVTIDDIVGGRYGDFRTGARDLPEVIRRFLQSVTERWGIAWVLLGGDVGVIPPRLVTGAIEGHMDVGSDNPPPDNKSFWTGSFLKMHVVSPGTWWPGNWPAILVNAGTGQLIPFDDSGATASGGLGWYYTTDDAYATRATMPTQFVRVNGPAAVVNARLQWLYQWNRIPTDLYYASLQGWVLAYHDIDFWLGTIRIPYVYFPAHDWDALDNGLYGQYVGAADVDGVHWHTDVSVGRAPVQSAVEAKAFVDKVIAYESFGGGMRVSLDGDWPRRVLLASSNWGDPVTITPTTADPPGNNRFRRRSDLTLIKLETVPASFDYQLIADISDSDRRELPWEPSNAPGSRGWHYARSATDHALNTIDIPLLWTTISFPFPSHWIVVRGPAEERNPRMYLLDQCRPGRVDGRPGDSARAACHGASGLEPSLPPLQGRDRSDAGAGGGRTGLPSHLRPDRGGHEHPPARSVAVGPRLRRRLLWCRDRDGAGTDERSLRLHRVRRLLSDQPSRHGGRVQRDADQECERRCGGVCRQYPVQLDRSWRRLSACVLPPAHFDAASWAAQRLPHLCGRHDVLARIRALGDVCAQPVGRSRDASVAHRPATLPSRDHLAARLAVGAQGGGARAQAGGAGRRCLRARATGRIRARRVARP